MILIDSQEVKFGMFPNKESNLNFNNITFNDSSVITLKFETDADLFNLYILKSYLDEFGAKPSLNILYMPYSRMDRRNQFYTFNLKYVCDFINSMNFSTVSVQDAHSDVTLALLDRCVNTSQIGNLFNDFLKDYKQRVREDEEKHGGFPPSDFLLFFPDAGAQKRYSHIFEGYPSAFGMKERSFGDSKIQSYKVAGEVKKGQDVVIVDDLCSRGGTFTAASEALKEAGAGTIYLIVSHCENAIFDGLIPYAGLIAGVYTTNSIVSEEVAEDWLYIRDVLNLRKREQ